MTSEGEFFEALNAACAKKLAGAVSGRRQRLRDFCAGRSADGGRQHFEAGRAAFPVCTSRNATAPIRWRATKLLQRAADYCRARKGPALVHAHVTRPYSHSLSDDEKLYKTARRTRKRSAPRSDFQVLLCSWCAKASSIEKELEALEAEVDPRNSRSHRPRAGRRAPAERIDSTWVYSPDVDPTSSAFEAQPRLHRRSEDHGGDGSRHAGRRDGARRAHRRLWRRRRRLQPRRKS